jgi:hypothetical protein
MDAVIEREAGTALTVIERASVALGAAKHEKRLVALAKGSTGIVAITNPASYSECHAARMALKRARIEIEGLGEGAREDARNFAKAVIAEQKRLIGIVQPEETRLQVIQDAHDAKVETERQAKQQAELDRLAAIRSRIDDLKQYAVNAIGKPAAGIALAMDGLEKEPIMPWAQEFADIATEAKVQTMNRLNVMFGKAQVDEAAAKAEAERLAEEHARIHAERVKLDRQKALQVERERQQKAEMDAAIARRLAEDQAARDKIEADARASRLRIEQDEREARARQDTLDREAKAAREAEETRLRGIREAEEGKLRAEREKLEKERLAKESRDRAAQEKADAKAKAKRDAEEAKQREIARRAADVMDAREMLGTFVERFGELAEFAGVVKAIKELNPPLDGFWES